MSCPAPAGALTVIREGVERTVERLHDGRRLFNVWCALQARSLCDIRMLLEHDDADIDELVSVGDLRYSLRGLLEGAIDLSRPNLVDIKLCPSGLRQRRVLEAIRPSSRPFDQHSEFALAFLISHWMSCANICINPLHARPTLPEVYSTSPEIRRLLAQTSAIAPYCLVIGEQRRALYTDRTKGFLLDPDVGMMSGYASASGLANVAREVAANLSWLASSDSFPSLPHRTFFGGAVLSLPRAGYSGLGDGWVGALGWGGSSFWLAHAAKDVYIGFVSDNPTRGHAATALLLRRAVDVGVGALDPVAFVEAAIG